MLAHVVPLASFLALQSCASLLRLDDAPDAPWWRTHPEQWVYPLQSLVGAGLLAFWWRHYRFSRLRVRQAITAVALAAAGILAWIAPVALGWTERTGGFDPRALGESPILVVPILAFRLLRLVVVVPLVEEIFWRGFLQRYLVDPDQDFQLIPMGAFTWPSALWTTAGVTFIHSPADWPAAALWGALVAFLYLKTRSLTACVLMHAAANAILGIYVLQTGAWGLW